MKENKPNNIYEKLLNFIKYTYKDIIFLLIFGFLMLYEFDYLIYRPGSSINLTERISGEDLYDINGNYYMNSVLVSKGTLPYIIASYFIDNWDIVPKEDVTIDTLDYDTTFKIEQLQLENAVNLAAITAYQKADEKVDIINNNKIVLYVDENAKTNLKTLDEIVKIDGKSLSNLEEVRNYINTLELDDKIDLDVIRDGKKIKCYAHVYLLENKKVMGISFLDKYEYTADKKIEFETNKSEAGASGGLMLTLTIYDYLTKEDLSKGRKVMGTGTIEEGGIVGAIGGVKYKLLGASKKGADIFFVPADNYDEAYEVYKENNLSFKLVKVNNIDDAINYLKK